ncbi:hypothetical protein JCM8208_007650 [Rhodotorula glutinis]
MPGQMSAPQHLTQLESLLVTLSRTRSSLPALLAAVSTSHAASPHDRTTVYRAASTECSSAVRALGDELDALEQVLRDAEDSASRDSTGIVVVRSSKRPRAAPATPPAPPRAAEHADEKPWVALGEILHGGVDATTTTPTAAASRKGKARAPYTPQLDPPTSPDELVALAHTWEAQYPRVRVRVGEKGRGGRARKLEVVLEGVMRATVGLRWEGEACEADWVTCHGLAEDKPPFLPSQFSLFQSLTDDATDLVDQARARRAQGEAATSVEEVLAFLSDPPLPF